ncbi:hypothetical protein CHUAL_008868 [Chamberlinius hualienensis]
MYWQIFVTFALFTVYCSEINGFATDKLLQEEFLLFQLEYGKNYLSTNEAEFRLENYLQNRWMIALHNQRYHRGLTSFTMKINRFADRVHNRLFKSVFFYLMSDFQSDEELIMGTAKFNTRNVTKNEFLHYHVLNTSLDTLDEPNELDWRNHKGVVNPVRDQGDCKAAWAVSFTEVVESYNRLVNHKSIVLSIQEFLDCTDIGCSSNFYDGVFFDAQYNQHKIGGIASDDDYPYTGKASLLN